MRDGLRKAAILVRSLPRADRELLVRNLTPAERADVAAGLAQLKRCRPGEQLAVRDALARNRRSTSQRSPAASIHRNLDDERPQTVAALLFDWPLESAVPFLAGLEPGRRTAVLRALQSSRLPSPTAEATLRETSRELGSDSTSPDASAMCAGAARLNALLSAAGDSMARQWRAEIGRC